MKTKGDSLSLRVLYHKIQWRTHIVPKNLDSSNRIHQDRQRYQYKDLFFTLAHIGDKAHRQIPREYSCFLDTNSQDTLSKCLAVAGGAETTLYRVDRMA